MKYRCRHAKILFVVFFLFTNLSICNANSITSRFDLKEWAEAIAIDPNMTEKFPAESDVKAMSIDDLKLIYNAVAHIPTVSIRRSIIKEKYLPLCQIVFECYYSHSKLLQDMALGRTCLWEEFRTTNQNISGKNILIRLDEYKTILGILINLSIDFVDYPPDYGNLRLLESKIYGGTDYMDKKDPLPDNLTDSLNLISNANEDANLSKIVSIVNQKYQDIDFLISNSTLLITLSTYLPSEQAGYIIGTIVNAYHHVSRMQEIKKTIETVIDKRWGKEWTESFFPIAEYLIDGIMNSSKAIRFFAYKDSLLAQGHDYAYYFPHLCPKDITKDDTFKDYADKYYEFLEYILQIASNNHEVFNYQFFNNIGCNDYNDFIKLLCSETFKRFYSTNDLRLLGNIEKISSLVENKYGNVPLSIITDLLECYIPINIQKANQFANKMSTDRWLENALKSEDITEETVFAVSVFAYLYASNVSDISKAHIIEQVIKLCSWIDVHFNKLNNPKEHKILKDHVILNVATALSLIGDYKNSTFWINKINYNTSYYSHELKLVLYDNYYNKEDASALLKVKIDHNSLSYYRLLQYFNCLVMKGKAYRKANYANAFSESLSNDFNMFYLMNEDDKDYAYRYAKNRTSCLFTDTMMYSWLLESSRRKNISYFKNQMSAMLYDWALASKGSLLRSTKYQLSLLKNNMTEDRYEYYKKHLSFDEDTNKENSTDELIISEMAHKVLLDMVRKDKPYNLQSFDYNLVKEQLIDNETAVEIIKLSIDDYVALVLQNNMEYPKLVELHLNNDDYCVSLWKGIEPYLTPNEKVFISLDGLFNTLNVECSKDTTGIMMMDKYKVFRVTTTLNIPQDIYLSDIRKSAIYGNLTYKNEDISNVDSNKRGASQVLSRNKSWIKLKETSKEVDSIYKLLVANKIECDLKQKEAGTKASFTSLSNNNIDLIHLATHGFYNKEDFIDGEYVPAMKRAGIVLSCSGMDLVYDKQSGTIFANEISRLDLNSVKLLVLSACETALGQEDDDGLIGLQRGFKQAGVGCIIMTLRKVNSVITTELMSSFYIYLSQGLSVREAFYKAQLMIRNKSYNDDWSAFIILD